MIKGLLKAVHNWQPADFLHFKHGRHTSRLNEISKCKREERNANLKDTRLRPRMEFLSLFKTHQTTSLPQVTAYIPPHRRAFKKCQFPLYPPSQASEPYHVCRGFHAETVTKRVGLGYSINQIGWQSSKHRKEILRTIHRVPAVAFSASGLSPRTMAQASFQTAVGGCRQMTGNVGDKVQGLKFDRFDRMVGSGFHLHSVRFRNI